MRTILEKIDLISEWVGRFVGWLVLVLILLITYEVGARYIFSAPTKWSYDLSYMIGGSLMVLGGAYALLHEAYVRVDVVYSRLQPKAKLIIDVILTLLFFLPLMSVALYYSTNAACTSWVSKEVSSVGYWEPIIWPFKWVFPVAIFMFLLQGIAWFIRNLLSLIKGGNL